MMAVPYYEVFRALSAEAMLVVTAFVALTLDLVSLRRAEMKMRSRTLGTVAIVGLLASVIPSVATVRTRTRSCCWAARSS